MATGRLGFDNGIRFGLLLSKYIKRWRYGNEEILTVQRSTIMAYSIAATSLAAAAGFTACSNTNNYTAQMDDLKDFEISPDESNELVSMNFEVVERPQPMRAKDLNSP